MMSRLVCCALAALATTLGCGRTSSPNDATLVVRGARIYTVDPMRPWAQAVAAREGRIVAIGSNADVESFIGPSTRVLDLADRLVLPGFVDTHVHPVSSGVEMGECHLSDVDSIAELRRRVTECGAKAGPGTWVRGGGYVITLFPGGNPSRHLLDSLVGDRPAFLASSDGHSAWVSSRALAMAGVTARTRDPLNGRIEREVDGSPSGSLWESAMALVGDQLPPHSDDELSKGLVRALALAARYGITTLHEASAREATLRSYARADSSGTLSARVVVSLLVDVDKGVEQVPALVALRQRYGRGLVRPVAAKIFADGVIEGQTAALLAPYVDRAGYRGELNLPTGRLDSLVQALDSAGFKVHVHAIGDRAIRVSLDAFERQKARDGGAGPRHIMAHLQLFDPADVGRFAQLGVVASFQPLWAYRDAYITDLTEPRLGPERSRHMYPIASIVKSGAIVAAGSDWSVTSLNPLEAMEVAVTRRALGDSTGPSWLPDERVELATIVKAYTLGGAMASDEESRVGSIEVGKSADLVVLSEDIFAVPPHRIHRAKVLLTLLQGREVFRDTTVIR
jgi:predicted amidohydrolase YtcJ